MTDNPNLTILGSTVRGSIDHVETFPKPAHVSEVTLICTEVTSVCPITGQPDFYNIEIIYRPNDLCVESKSLKLYLQGFREKGLFGEAFSGELAEFLMKALKAEWVSVTVKQTPRGGIAIHSTSDIWEDDPTLDKDDDNG